MADQKKSINHINTALKIDKEKSKKIDSGLIPKDKICIDNKTKTDDGPLLADQINNQVPNESTDNLEDGELVDNVESVERNDKHLLKKKSCVNNKSNLENQLPSTSTAEKHMLPRSLGTLENTVNNRKRNQNQNEVSNENIHWTLKRIKIEDNRDNLFRHMWNYLQQDFSKFHEWVNILNVVDYHDIVDNARMAYSKFLELYPLCYGYWKKYANFEKRNNNINEFKKILENGLNAIPVSVDLWIYYTDYLKLESNNEDVFIRKEFERSLKMCGLDYHSDRLWFNYISWEIEKNEIFNAVNIYYRLIRTPTSNCFKNFLKFQEFIFKNIPEKYLGLAEFNKRRSIIIESLETNQRKLLASDSLPPGDDSINITESTDNNIISIVRISFIESWYNVHSQTIKEFESRKIFEENIERTHFHVKKLKIDQILNWEKYIKFEKKAGNQERIIFLYERCLVSCVSHEKFWLSYLEYLSSINIDVTDLLIDVFKRSLFHHPKSLDLNLKYFNFSENKGWIEKANETITKLGLLYPNSKDVTIRIINLARRKQDETLKSLFKHHLICSQSKSYSSYIAVKYARFVWKHDRQLNLAFNILNDTIRHKNISVNDNFEIYLTLVELKMELSLKDYKSVIKTIDDIISACKLLKDKIAFSKKKVEYIEDYIQEYRLLHLAKIEYKNLKDMNYKKTAME